MSPDLELLTDRNHLDLAEELLQGGMFSLYTKRLFTPNNKCLGSFDDTQKSTYGLNIDASNLNGGSMKDFCLPLNSFQTDTKVTIEQILQTPDDAEFEYIVCVDLDYPGSIHDAHQDFPMAPTREPVDSMWLSSNPLDILEEYHLPKASKCNKLLQTLYDKKYYTLHYVTLKIYERNGIKVSKLHKVLKFRESKWLAKYIELNTKLRQAATSKVAENFFKLMNDSAFGKCYKSMRNRVNAFLVRDEQALLNHTDKFYMKSFKIFDENMAVVTTRKTKINWVKRTIVGASILDLSKAFMFRFQYDNMKQRFKCELLYSERTQLPMLSIVMTCMRCWHEQKSAQNSISQITLLITHCTTQKIIW